MIQVNRANRIRAALASAAAALLVLIVMSLNIGGTANFVSILANYSIHFVGVSLIASSIGCSLAIQRMRWHLIAGALTGLVGGWIILLFTVSHI